MNFLNSYRDSGVLHDPLTWASKGSLWWRWSKSVFRISLASDQGSPVPGWSPSPDRRSDVRLIRTRTATVGSFATIFPDAARKPRFSVAPRKCPRSSIRSKKPDPRTAAFCGACSSLGYNRRSPGSRDPSPRRLVSFPGSCAWPSSAPRLSRNTTVSFPWWFDRLESGAFCV